MAYIEKEPIIKFITKGLNNPDKIKAFGYDAAEILTEIEYQPTADVVEVVRCKDCDVPHNKWLGCPNLNGLIPPPDFYCAKGIRKPKKETINCIDCKHHMFSDFYIECSKHVKLVNGDDTCEDAEPKERGEK